MSSLDEVYSADRQRRLHHLEMAGAYLDDAQDLVNSEVVSGGELLIANAILGLAHAVLAKP